MRKRETWDLREKERLRLWEDDGITEKIWEKKNEFKEFETLNMIWGVGGNVLL